MASIKILLLLVLHAFTFVNGEDPTPSPDSEFILQPSNVTVPVGEKAVLKCMTAEKVHLCRWYFLELDLQFFEKRITPMLVKEFSPKSRQDCSIKIEKVKKIQEGQWLCQAFKFQSSKFIMSKPATLRVITESESATWEPPKDETQLSPRNGRREDDDDSLEDHLEFHTTDEDIIQDVFIHESTLLKCKTNQPLETCSWIMPSGVNLTATRDEDETEQQSNELDGYKITGNLSEGICSLALTKVSLHDEGNWRCIVRPTGVTEDANGPLLHLHILDHNSASKHTHDGQPISNEDEDSVNYLVISLVIISGMLFVIVLLLLMFLYRRLRGSNEETKRILQNSPRNSMDFNTKMVPNTDLTSASVMAVEQRKKLPYDEYNHGNYNQYLDMRGSGENSVDGYVMMPGSSIRSSTSSRTTLSTLSTFPIGRSRSASNSTTDSGVFPHLTTIIDNPSYSPDVHQRGLRRPDSVYSNDHVYEEIKEKIDEIVNKMEKIPEADSPTYINTTQDAEGYLVPKKSPNADQSEEEVIKASNFEHITKSPLPELTKAIKSDECHIQNTNEHNEPPPPYSRVGSNGLVPVPSTLQSPDLGYSKIGNDMQNQPDPIDPMERYDIPRPNPQHLIDSYDVPRQNPIPISSQPNSPLDTNVEVDGLSGIIV